MCQAGYALQSRRIREPDARSITRGCQLLDRRSQHPRRKNAPGCFPPIPYRPFLLDESPDLPLRTFLVPVLATVSRFGHSPPGDRIVSQIRLQNSRSTIPPVNDAITRAVPLRRLPRQPAEPVP